MKYVFGPCLVVPFLSLISVYAQTDAGKVSCAVLPASPVTDADKALAAGHASDADKLYKAQLSGTATVAAYVGAVRSEIALNEMAEAEATARAGMAAMPKSGDVAALLGDALLRAGQVPEANAAYTKALELERCSSRAHYGLGRIGDLLSHHLAAAKEYTIAYAIAPSDPEIEVAFAGTLPTEKQGAALKAILASNPILTPEGLDKLTTSEAILEQHLSCTPVVPNEAAKLPLLAIMLYGTHARSFGIKAKLNDAELPILELDSSTEGIVLNPGDAKKAKVRPLLAAGKESPDGMYYGVAEHIKIGNLEYKDCPVRVAKAAALANANSLIGTEFFKDHLIHIDYVLKTLTLTPYKTVATGLTEREIAPEQKDWSTVYINGPDILIPTFLNKKGPYLFLLDTGSNITVFSPLVSKSALMQVRDANLNLHGTSAAIVKVIPKFGGSDDDHTLVYGGDGKLVKAAQPFKVPILQFANNQFNDDNALSYDLTGKSHADGIEVSGLIGFSTLREFFEDIDYRNGLVKILYDFNHLYTIRDMDRSQ